MAEVNNAQPGSQPASGGINNGSVTGGFEMVGMGMGGGAGVSPPCSNVGGMSMTDITLEQALGRMQELVRENTEMREYLKENNEMMKKQFETLAQWKQKVHDANVMNRDKFEQTRALITALRTENEELHKRVGAQDAQEESLTARVRSLEAELNSLKSAKAASDQLAYNVVKQAQQQGVEVGEEETNMRETVYVASAEKEERIMELEAEVERGGAELEQLKERAARLEHDNTQFRANTEQLLKDLEATQQLKQQIQGENQDLQQETLELRQQMQAMLSDTKNSLQRAPTLMGFTVTPASKGEASLAGSGEEGEMGQTRDQSREDWQEESKVVTAEVNQLHQQLTQHKDRLGSLTADLAAAQLEISQLHSQLEVQRSEMESMQGRHDDRIRQLQREHESRVEHMQLQQSQDSSLHQQHVVSATHAEDVQTLRSQVLTLINEVHETQNKLGAAQRLAETKAARVKELEAYCRQLVEESRSHVRQLQQALAMGEKQLATEQQNHATTKHQMGELRKSFNQLVSDYKEVLDTFDHYKAEQEQRLRSTSIQRQHLDTINHLTAQVIAAEEAINMREEKVVKLQHDLKDRDETVDVLNAQAEVYKADFLAEREARSRLATEKERVSQELEAEQLKTQGLTDQLTRYAQQQLQDMQLRAAPQPHYQPLQRFPPHPYPGGDRAPAATPPCNAPLNNLSATSLAQSPQGRNFHPAYVHPPHNYRGPLGPNTQHGSAAAHQTEAAGGNPGPGLQAAGFNTSWPGREPGEGLLQGGAQPEAQQHEEEEPMLYICPSCEQRLPDLDTLTIHVQDCLDQNAS